MPDNNAFANALLAALQRQRNAAQDLCARAEANVAVLEEDNARLAAENAKLREGPKKKRKAAAKAPKGKQGKE